MEDIYHLLNPWWDNRSFDAGYARPLYLQQWRHPLQHKQIDILLGSRRCGKTTLLRQIIQQQLQDGLAANRIFYLALDHPQLQATLLSEHLKNFRKLHSHQRNTPLLLVLDEVHESPNWENELKALYDHESVKLIITGSTAALLQRQRGRLTGRQRVTTIYPLSFAEFLAFQKESIAKTESYLLEKKAEDYLNIGGYPEQVLRPDPLYLSNLLEDILFRDIVRLYQLRKATVLKDLIRLLAAAVGSRTSFNKLANVLSLSVDTVKEYIGYLEQAFLVTRVEKWSPSSKDRIYSQKKIYFVDTGIKSLLTGTGDLGHKAENAVLLSLLQQGQETQYFAESQREVDFILGGFEKPQPIEVKYEDNLSWDSPKLRGLKLFLQRQAKTRQATVITKNQMDTWHQDDCTIELIPLWKFLLS